jgi:phosphopantothenoylcysteine decarboxylase/phosphopantothenate--cysteine ligase
VLVGFAAEAGGDGLERARAKRTRKQVDLVVHNDISLDGTGFGSDDNAITIIGPDTRERTYPRASKADCAQAVMDAAVALLHHESEDGHP